eukprot:m.967 g.967  ORF g.967 m.967 type:complete len:63 (+) comp955_c0_seq1:91-279(+)
MIGIHTIKPSTTSTTTTTTQTATTTNCNPIITNVNQTTPQPLPPLCCDVNVQYVRVHKNTQE